MNDYQFGNFVCELREQKGLTQADVAQRLNVTPAAVSKWENGASKPRVEVLFALAKLLEVRPEELIAGKRLEEPAPDPEAVKQIFERYEALCRIDATTSVPNRFRRLLAALLDWWIFGIVTFAGLELLFVLTAPLLGEDGSVPLLFVIPFLFLVFFFAYGFMLRDLIFGGRSLGKRMLGLVVLDSRTGGKTKLWQRLVRNLFLQIYPVDIIVLLVTGLTLGDRCARTLVIPKKEVARLEKAREEQDPIQSINHYQAPQKKRSKWLIPVICGAVALVLVLAVCVTGFVLLYQREYEDHDEEYDAVQALTREYTVNSQTFAEKGYDAADVSIASYTSSQSSGHKDEQIQKLARFEYRIRLFASMTVTCHQRDGEWYVCPECTEFQ